MLPQQMAHVFDTSDRPPTVNVFNAQQAGSTETLSAWLHFADQMESFLAYYRSQPLMVYPPHVLTQHGVSPPGAAEQYIVQPSPMPQRDLTEVSVTPAPLDTTNLHTHMGGAPQARRGLSEQLGQLPTIPDVSPGASPACMPRCVSR